MNRFRKFLIKKLLGRLIVIDGIKIEAKKGNFILRCDSFEMESSGFKTTKIKINGKPFDYATRLVVDIKGDSVTSKMDILCVEKDIK